MPMGLAKHHPLKQCRIVQHHGHFWQINTSKTSLYEVCHSWTIQILMVSSPLPESSILPFEANAIVLT